jgi:hypothetical protein
LLAEYGRRIEEKNEEVKSVELKKSNPRNDRSQAAPVIRTG